MYFAHSAKVSRAWQPLADHLRTVGDLAASFASCFDASEEARLAGLLHDLGKYGDLFQRRLQGKEHGIDHWSAGAWAALNQWCALSAAAVIQGHHVGLQQLDSDSLRGLNPVRLSAAHPLGLRLSEASIDLLTSRLHDDGLEPPVSVAPVYGRGFRETASAMLDVRMLFSALVDADFLDTDAHFRARPAPAAPLASETPLDQEKALSILMEHIAGLAASSFASEAVNGMRADLLDVCLAAAHMSQGLWTLSAPTGAGKTLAMLAFALQHAAVHNLRRVVMVIPYLSIIEQTAGIYRDILCTRFGSDFVREHHSLAGTRREPEPQLASDLDGDNEAYFRPRSLADNWDAPLIVTTSVQFLESLFSNRPSACRKLHRLARSVILFDEVQTLPDHLSIPTLATLSWLAERYKATVVFSTATQPAFRRLDSAVRSLGDAGWAPREIVPPALGLFARARRTEVAWPDLECATAWQDLAAELAGLPQALCVVNVKRHARDLFSQVNERCSEGTYHLSTAMCPRHRQAVLRLVRRRLERDMPCRLISTQCVEAGVDIDFPVVYRAFGPLEAVAQAAGRCNRNGRLSTGEVRVFVPEEEPGRRSLPFGAYEQATSVTRALLKERGPAGMDIADPALFEEYYRRFYTIARPEEKRPELWDAIRRQDFAEVAARYRLIEQDTISVLVPYRKLDFDRLVQEVRERGLTADWMRRAQPQVVGVYRPKGNDPIWTCLEPVPIAGRSHSEEWFIYRVAEDYDRDLGLLPRQGPDVWLV